MARDIRPLAMADSDDEWDMLGPEDILPPSFGPAAAAEPEISPKSATILQERLPAPPPIVDSGHQDAVSMKGTNEEEEEAVPDLNEVPSLEELARVEAETPPRPVFPWRPRRQKCARDVTALTEA